MPCTCNAICDNDCAGNSVVCIGHENDCDGNGYAFTPIPIGTIITAAQLQELELAINEERTNTTYAPPRRYNAIPPGCVGDCDLFTSVACSNNEFGEYIFPGSRSVGDLIEALHFTNIKNVNNEVTNDSGFGGTVTNNFTIGNIIYASFATDLQNKINETREVCICDTHCSCHPGNCGCDGECPGDDYYNPYYYYYP